MLSMVALPEVEIDGHELAESEESGGAQVRVLRGNAGMREGTSARVETSGSWSPAGGEVVTWLRSVRFLQRRDTMGATPPIRLRQLAVPLGPIRISLSLSSSMASRSASAAAPTPSSALMSS